MHFDFQARIRKLRKELIRQKLAAFITVTIENNNKNAYYLSGFGGTTGALAVSKDKAVLAVDARYTARAKKEARGVRVVPIPKNVRRSGDFSHYVETSLNALAMKKNARIGFEGKRISVLMIKTWTKELKRSFVPTENIVERLRQVKDADEIKNLAHAARVTSAVFSEVSNKIRAGMRECDIARMLTVALLEHGALGTSFETIIASGANSAIPHHETGTRTVKAGEPVVLDFGGVFPGGYCSDLTRTVFVLGKKPNPKLLEMYRITLEANKYAFRALKPGLTWKEYDGAARSYIEEKGYGKYFTHGLGHSIGLEVHDPFDHTTGMFKPGMVFSNEPGIYIEGLGGIRIEDDVVVTKTGARRLTNAPYLHV